MANEVKEDSTVGTSSIYSSYLVGTSSIYSSYLGTSSIYSSYLVYTTTSGRCIQNLDQNLGGWGGGAMV